MASSIDRSAYATEFDLFDRALTSERGVMVSFATQGEANKLRERLNKARALDREFNRRIHREDPEHPMYGSSEYAIFVIKTVFSPERGMWFCRLEKGRIESLTIEEIPPPEGEEDVEADL